MDMTQNKCCRHGANLRRRRRRRRKILRSIIFSCKMCIRDSIKSDGTASVYHKACGYMDWKDRLHRHRGSEREMCIRDRRTVL